MGPQSVLNTSKALEGVRGVHVVPHAPFAVEEISQHGDQGSNCGISKTRSNQHFLLMQRIQQQISVRFRPVHCSLNVGDRNVVETIANVITSLPFIALGVQTPRKNFNSKLYGNSLIGVGVASSMYHCSRGRVRKFMRWVDYTMIATATVCCSHLYATFSGASASDELVNEVFSHCQLNSMSAVRSENPKYLMAASALCLPFQPLMVSMVHTGMMEVAFAKRALKDPQLRMAHNVHKASSLLGGVLFVADDVFPQTPYLHAAWHLAAAVGVGTCNKLLE